MSDSPNEGLSRSGTLQEKIVSAVLIVVGFLGTLALGIAVGRGTIPLDVRSAFIWSVTCFLFGTAVGLSEILSRHRDEPLLATTTPAGILYLLVNGVIALAAFALLRRYTTLFPSIKDDFFLTAVAAGFGGMTVLRSKLFTFSGADGKEYPIGPDVTGHFCTKWNERESTWRKSGSCPCRGTNQSKS